MERTLRNDLERCTRLERRLLLKQAVAIALVVLTILVRAFFFT